MKKENVKVLNNVTTNPPVCRARQYQIMPVSAESLKSVFYSFLSSGWGDTVPLINLCGGTERKWNDADFFLFHKDLFEVAIRYL